tara:strand:- start:151 stop:579 length:429 start_codon:yes stop_codon:yes gene_type:complete
MQLIGTFDFRDLIVNFGGINITGYAEGDAVEVSEENDAFNSVSGADGYVDRVKNNSNFLNITLRIRQTSPTNQLLSAAHNADRLAGVVLPILIKDVSGTTLITASAAWVTRHPSITYGNEAKEREWSIKTGSVYAINLGGNK